MVGVMVEMSPCGRKTARSSRAGDALSLTAITDDNVDDEDEQLDHAACYLLLLVLSASSGQGRA